MDHIQNTVCVIVHVTVRKGCGTKRSLSTLNYLQQFLVEPDVVILIRHSDPDASPLRSVILPASTTSLSGRAGTQTLLSRF